MRLNLRGLIFPYGCYPNNTVKPSQNRPILNIIPILPSIPAPLFHNETPLKMGSTSERFGKGTQLLDSRYYSPEAHPKGGREKGKGGSHYNTTVSNRCVQYFLRDKLVMFPILLQYIIGIQRVENVSDYSAVEIVIIIGIQRVENISWIS